MISLKDLIDNKTSYSTTRWAFVVAMRFAIIMEIVAFIVFIVLRFMGKSTDGLLTGVTALLGTIVGIATAAKALQGFETKHNDTTEESNTEIETEKPEI